MATIATEPWTATSTTAWPSQWSVGVNQGTASVASGYGRLTPSGTGYKTVRRLLTGVATSSAPRQTTGTIRFQAVTEQYVKISGREQVGTTDGYPNGYYLQIAPGTGTTGSWTIRAAYGADEYGDAAAVPVTTVAGSVYGYTILVTGFVVSARVWNITSGQTEPTGWQLTWEDTDNAYPTGVPALSQQSGSASTAYVEFGPVTVTDGTAAASPNGSMMLAF